MSGIFTLVALQPRVRSLSYLFVLRVRFQIDLALFGAITDNLLRIGLGDLRRLARLRPIAVAPQLPVLQEVLPF